MHWALKLKGGLLGREVCLEKVGVESWFLACGAPLGRVLMGSLTGLMMKREELSWYGRCLDRSISILEQPFSKGGGSGTASGGGGFFIGFCLTACCALRFCES